MSSTLDATALDQQDKQHHIHPMTNPVMLQEKGPEMAKLLPLIGRTKAIARLRGQAA